MIVIVYNRTVPSILQLVELSRQLDAIEANPSLKPIEAAEIATLRMLITVSLVMK